MRTAVSNVTRGVTLGSNDEARMTNDGIMAKHQCGRGRCPQRTRLDVIYAAGCLMG